MRFAKSRALIQLLPDRVVQRLRAMAENQGAIIQEIIGEFVSVHIIEPASPPVRHVQRVRSAKALYLRPHAHRKNFLGFLIHLPGLRVFFPVPHSVYPLLSSYPSFTTRLT